MTLNRIRATLKACRDRASAELERNRKRAQHSKKALDANMAQDKVQKEEISFLAVEWSRQKALLADAEAWYLQIVTTLNEFEGMVSNIDALVDIFVIERHSPPACEPDNESGGGDDVR